MTLLTWNSASTVGVKAMDDQHGILMDAVNDLRQVMLHGAGRERIAEELNRVLEFARMHFASEEQLLQQCNYPDLAEHRDAHARLLRQIGEMSQHALYGECVEMSALLTFLRSWFNEHIDGFDRHYGSWMNERGIQ